MAAPAPSEGQNGTAVATTSPKRTPTGTPSAYLSARELAHELSCHRASIYRLAKDNPDMPQLHLGGGLIRFPRDRVMAWLRRREGRPA
jgi:excisionase family DNA binding protein